MSTTETLTWFTPAERMPDDDETVLLEHRPENVTGDLVWPGYHDGDDGWRLADGAPCKPPKRWAAMPLGGDAADQELEDARTELEEMEEAGDLEDRLHASLRVAKAERRAGVA